MLFQSVPTLYSAPLSPTLAPELNMLDMDVNTSPDLNLNMNSYDLIAHGDADQLSLEIEKER